MNDSVMLADLIKYLQKKSHIVFTTLVWDAVKKALKVTHPKNFHLVKYILFEYFLILLYKIVQNSLLKCFHLSNNKLIIFV